MKISQVIEILKKYKEKEGDLPIYYLEERYGSIYEFEIKEDLFGIFEPEHTCENTDYPESNRELIYPKRLTLLSN